MKKGADLKTPRGPHWCETSKEKAWIAPDGKKMPYAVWPDKPEKSPAAILLCVHGLSGAASDFWPLGEVLPKKNIHVYGLQLRGQGHDLDIKERGTIRHARQWWNDVQNFHLLLRRRHPHTPIFWLGESLGSLITMHALTQSAPPTDVSGYIILSPPVKLRPTLSSWQIFLIRPLMTLMPFLKVDLRTLGGGVGRDMKITSESTQASQAPLTPHFVPRQSLKVLREIERQMRTAHQCAAALKLPTLLLYTPNDPICSHHDMEHWFDQISATDKTRFFYEKNYHLILHDNERWDACARIEAWMLKRSNHCK